MTNTPNRPLDGQRAIVTGGSSGIGAAVARALAIAGAKVIVNFVGDDAGAERVVANIVAAGGEALAVRADVSREDQVGSLFATVVDAWSGLDILVNNAGIQRDAAFVDMSYEDWKAVIDVNLGGQFLCAREAARLFLRQGVRPEISVAAGKIICISSVHDVIPWAGRINYAAAKSGVSMMMKSIAQELAGHKVRVNAISPGAIKTDINRAAWETAESEARLLTLIPYGRVGDPADIANAAVWLASDDSDYVTGTTLYVDGGMTLYPSFIDNG